MIADGGGQATITSDRLSESGLELAELSAATAQAPGGDPVPRRPRWRIRWMWPAASDADPEVLARCVEIVADDDNVDAVFLVGMFGGYHIRLPSPCSAARCARPRP